MWDSFVNKTKDRKPVPLVMEALSRIKEPEGKVALDLGCGAGVEVRAIREAGFFVYAVDSEPEAIKNLDGILSVITFSGYMEHFAFNIPCDLVVAWNSLPFLKKNDAKKVILRVKESLNPEGLFVFSVFGKKDGFVKQGLANGFARQEIKNCLSGMKLLHFSETEKEAVDASGEMKHWHLFTGIAQKI
jgi:tellurite methyltransferase